MKATKEISDYEQQANDLLTKLGIEFKAEYLKNDFHFEGDEEKRDIYKITLKRGKRSYSFNFGQSIMRSGKYIIYSNPGTYSHSIPKGMFLNKDYHHNIKFQVPTAYDVLACLTKYDLGTFEDFCSEYGYDTDSRKAEKTYKAVCEEYLNVCSLFNDAELIELQEIQ